jgi:DNA repair exonuclease SbcCD ATPase subunit
VDTIDTETNMTEMKTTRPTLEQIAEARELLGDANNEVRDGISLNYHGLKALRVLLAATAPADDAATYTPDELAFLDNAASDFTRLLFTTEKTGTWDFMIAAAWRLAAVALAERRKTRGCAKVLDELHKQPRMTLLQQAELRAYGRVCKIIEDAKLPLCDGKDEVECVEAMIARLRELEPAHAKKDILLGRAAILIENIAEAVDDPVFASQSKEEAARLHAAAKEGVERALAKHDEATRAQMALQTELDQAKDRLQRAETDLGEKRTRIAELETQLADQAPKVKEFFAAIDALAEAWPRDVPIEDNPTLAVWIRKLAAVLGEKAKQQTANALGTVRKRIESALGMPMSGLLDIIERKHALRAVDEELAALDPNPHDGCLDCNGTGWVNGIVGSACDVPRKAPTRQ